jgi:hypothetical protein
MVGVEDAAETKIPLILPACCLRRVVAEIIA